MSASSKRDKDNQNWDLVGIKRLKNLLSLHQQGQKELLLFALSNSIFGQNDQMIYHNQTKEQLQKKNVEELFNFYNGKVHQCLYYSLTFSYTIER